MPKYSVDVKAFIAFEVEAENEDDARAVADAFVENCLVAEHATVEGYNEGLDDPIGAVVPSEIVPSVDGETDVILIDWEYDDV